MKFIYSKIINKKVISLMMTVSIVLILAFISNMWVLSKKNGFVFDDYSWLFKAKFNDYSQIINILPQSKYNDRPVGAVIIKIMYDLFGLNQRYHHTVLLLIHLFNTFLVFGLIYNILRRLKKDNYKYLPMLAAGIFGIWPKSLMCVQWDAAIFDLFGATLALLVFNLYISNKLDSKYKEFNNILIVLIYFAALRTKEMTIVIPVLIGIYEIFEYIRKGGINKETLKRFRFSRITLVLSLIMVFYYMLISSLSSNVTTDINSPYYYTFNPVILVRNLFRFISLYFDFLNLNFSFVSFNILTISILTILGSIFVYSIYLFAKKEYSLFFIFIGIFISLSPVLPMKNMQHVLYLYIPSIFISILISLIINRVILKIIKKDLFVFSVNLMIIILILATTYSKPIKAGRDYWLTVGQNNQISINDLRKLPKPQSGSNMYITNVSDNYNVFYYGPGFINNIIFDDQTLKTYINPDTIDKSKPYMTVQYNNGNLKLVEKTTKEIIIEKTSPSQIFVNTFFNKQPNNSSAIIVEGKGFTPNCKIYMNNIPLETTYGNENLLTALVAMEFYSSERKITLEVKTNDNHSNKLLINVTNQ